MTPLVIPPAMPLTSEIKLKKAKSIDYYEIAVRQFQQQVLPFPLPATTVWGYGSVNHEGTFNYPAFTIEATYDKPVRVKWINDLVDEDGDFLPHLLPVDPTLHWANPTGVCRDGSSGSDCPGAVSGPYTGPVPIVTHLHGAHSAQQFDGYPEAWYLPDAQNLPVNFTHGKLYEYFEELAEADGIEWEPGSATFEYANDQPATTLWYHDHALGITRINVYAGPAGFYLLREGPKDLEEGVLPGPAPAVGDPPDTKYYEIPIAIQDRSFNPDGSLFYPDNRAFFEGLLPDWLKIPFLPDEDSDVAPVHNPEFFGETIVVNGQTWPFLEVEPRRYRFRLLNGAQSRFFLLALEILDTSEVLPFWQIGADGGFLPEPVEQDWLLMGPAERADVIVDFSELPPGTEVTMLNLGPDEPFGGGMPGEDFEPSDPATTGQVMRFTVVEGDSSMPDTSADPALGELELPRPNSIGKPAKAPRRLSLNELDSEKVLVTESNGEIVVDSSGEPFGPVAALLGTVENGHPVPFNWGDPTTEILKLGAPEEWEIYNFTADAHPIHIHQVQFQVINRQELASDDGVVLVPVQFAEDPMKPEVGELGFKDTVIAYPGQVTRIRARFDLFGLYVWHCHILEHEDNEMMRRFHVGKIPDALPIAQ